MANQGCAVHNCNGVVVMDTDAWTHPLCPHHYEVFGAPYSEPDWERVIEICKFEPRVFDFRNAQPEKPKPHQKEG